MTNRLLVFAALSALFFTGLAGAATIAFAPPMQSAGLGDFLNIDVEVSGLGSFTAPSLSGFDFLVNYNSAVLVPTNVTYGSMLGDPSLFEAVTLTDLSTPGQASLFEVSILLPGALDALQPDAFVLATLQFNAIGEGSSPLSFSNATLSDGFGNPLDLQLGSGSVRIGEIPEPGYFWPITVLLLGGVVFRRRQTAKTTEARLGSGGLSRRR